MTSSPPAIRVAVNDRQLLVAAVLERGKVLVPLRAVVEALGGTVDRFRLPLPPPARIIAGRTYAPIRFLAEELHAQIQYDGRAHLVQVFTNAAAAPASAPSAVPPGVSNARNPQAGMRVGTAYPTISDTLSLPPGAAISRLTMSVDGVVVTNDAQYAGSFVTYIPRDGLSAGSHTVALAGVSTDGTPFSDSWSFETTRAAAAPAEPAYGAAPLRLNVWGSQFIGGAPIAVELTAPPGGEAFAFVCTSAYQFPLYAAPSSQFYSASIPTRNVGAPIDCPVTAMYVSWNGAVTYAPYPVFVRLIPQRTPAPPTPAPVPTRIPRPVPVHTHLPEPTATPKPSATPTGARRPLPIRMTPPPR